RGSFISDGTGSNTRFKLNFGRLYKVDKIVVYDLQNATDAHITKFELKFSDGTAIEATFDDIDHPLCKVVNLVQTKMTNSVQLSVRSFVNGADLARRADVG